MKGNGDTNQEVELCEEILGHIFKKNYFEFNKTYLQICDTAMNNRNRLEEAWIFSLNTMTPSGLNTKW